MSQYTRGLAANERVMMALVRAAECFKRYQADLLRSYGLSFPQYNVLRVLEASEGHRNNMSGVGKVLLAPVANMTGLARRLEGGGFLVRRSDPKDERVTILELTPKGQRALQDIQQPKDEALEVILQGFSGEERRFMLRGLKQIIDNCLSAMKQSTINTI